MSKVSSLTQTAPVSPQAKSLVENLLALYTNLPKPIALHEPQFGTLEKRYTQDCIESGWVSSVGQFVNRFEADLGAYTGIPYVVATVNGTAALHLALTVSGVLADDEVLVPALTFVATANAVRYCSAIPHFVESHWETLGVDPEKLETYLGQCLDRQGRNKHTGRRVKALVVVHTFGHAAQLDALARVCNHFGLTLIEDAAESLGSHFQGQHTGGVGRIAAMSFNGNKIITTGGGGALLTHDPILAERARHLSTTAKASHPWAFFHDTVGFNYRMPNLNAALGCAQLQQLDTLLAQKQQLANYYREYWSTSPGANLFWPSTANESNHWLNALKLSPHLWDERDAILNAAHQHEILLRPCWTLMPDLPAFRDCPRMPLDVTQTMAQSLLCLPSSASLINPLSSTH